MKSHSRKAPLLPFNSLWARYFLKETLKVFFLFLFCFYGLYVLIDFSSHASNLHHHHIRFRWNDLAIYYLADFVKRMDVLVPFALLIATIKTLCSLNIHNELVALMANGIALKTLLRPFVFLGLLCTVLIYLNTEFFLPHSLASIKHIDNSHSRQKNKNRELPSVQHLVLDDESTILFQNFDTSRQVFSDAYWIRSLDDIYRFKFLYPYTDIPLGSYVDHFTRDPAGKLELKQSYVVRLFPEIHFNTATLMETLTPMEDLSLTQLKDKLPEMRGLLTEKQAQTVAVFYYKMAMPWLCLLAVIAPLSFCVRYTRQLPVFFIYAGSIFGLVSFYLLIDATLILGKRQVIDPLWAIGLPFAIFFGFFTYRYARL